MSIYSTRTIIDSRTLAGLVSDMGGQVRTYQGSHVYQPGDHIGPGIDTAHVPEWCVPGHEDADPDQIAVGEWLRLSVGELSVLIDADAARELGEDLLAWAATRKVKAVTRG